MSLSPELLTIVALLALAFAGFALFVVVNSVPKGNRKLSDDKQAVLLLTKHDQDLANLKVAFRQLTEGQRRQGEGLLRTVQRVGLVRYDAFDDMGGHLSFSAALLDGQGNGLVITSINGRQDTRCYAKPVEGWTSNHNLSEEEELAIQRALTSGQPSQQMRLAAPAQGRTPTA
ncbi:MAG: DUF4446 family protein [Actinomycetota bacterium]